MPDRTDPEFPRPRGPWPEVHDDDRVFDHGAAWCINADGHPGFARDYPDPMRHIPAYECRSAGLFLDVAEGLTGNSCELDAYLGRPYRFGELRSVASVDETRVVFDYFGAATDTTARFSVSLGDALRLALHLLSLVRRIDGLPDTKPYRVNTSFDERDHHG